MENSASVNIINEESGDYHSKKPEFNNNREITPAYVRFDNFLRQSVENIYFYALIILISIVSIVVITIVVWCFSMGNR